MVVALCFCEFAAQPNEAERKLCVLPASSLVGTYLHLHRIRVAKSVAKKMCFCTIRNDERVGIATRTRCLCCAISWLVQKWGTPHTRQQGIHNKERKMAAHAPARKGRTPSRPHSHDLACPAHCDPYASYSYPRALARSCVLLYSSTIHPSLVLH